MRTSRILEKLRRDEPALLTQLHLTDESIWELASLSGFDGIWMDLEHHHYSVETANRMMRATRVGDCDIVARAARGEMMRFARLLEAGATGIMYPRCESAEEAAEIVRNAKFSPQGERGFDGGNPDMPYCTMPTAEYIEKANRETFVVIQIESPTALENVEAIADVAGVDVLFFGPSDFSILSGVAGQMDHPTIAEAVDRVAAAAAGAGKKWGTPAFSVDHARVLLDKGARFLCHGADIIFVKQGFEAMREQFSELGVHIESRLDS